MNVIWYDDKFKLLENGNIIAFTKLTDSEVEEIKRYYRNLLA